MNEMNKLINYKFCVYNIHRAQKDNSVKLI